MNNPCFEAVTPELSVVLIFITLFHMINNNPTKI
jgi:hypothetical protein